MASENNAVGMIVVTFDPSELASPTREQEVVVEAIATLAAPTLESLQQAGASQRAVEALRNILTPELPPAVPGAEIYAAFKAAEGFGFAGDFFDILKLDSDKWGFILGDISGKGLAAGRYTAMAKYVIRSYILEYDSVATALSQTNGAIAAQIEESMFITLFVLVLNIQTHALIYGSAGHFPALKYCLKKDQFVELSANGGALGINHYMEYSEGSEVLDPGDLLTIYTDGVIEARQSGRLYGIERLQDAIRTNKDKCLSDIAQAIVDDVLRFTDNQLQDDLTFILIRLKQ
jgi:serine phosphatase RsbU (regulator of sigma subunit)